MPLTAINPSVAIFSPISIYYDDFLKLWIPRLTPGFIVNEQSLKELFCSLEGEYIFYGRIVLQWPLHILAKYDLLPKQATLLHPKRVIITYCCYFDGTLPDRVKDL